MFCLCFGLCLHCLQDPELRPPLDLRPTLLPAAGAAPAPRVPDPRGFHLLRAPLANPAVRAGAGLPLTPLFPACMESFPPPSW